MSKDLLVQVAGDETQLNRALDRAEARLGKYGASVVAESNAQAAAYRKIGEGSAYASGQAERYAIAQEASTRRVKVGLSEMLASHSHAMQSIGDSTVAAGRKINTAGSTMLGIVGPLDLAGGAAVKLAVDFSKAMEQLHTQAGYSQRDVEKLSKAVLQLSPQVGSSPKELAEGLFHIASAGLPAAKAMETVKEAAIGAKIGGSSLEETTYALVSVMKTAPKDIHSAADAMGLMNAIVGQGDLHMQDLVKSLSSGVVPAAKGAGLGMRDVGAAMDVLTARGVPAEVAGTRLQRTFGFMEKSSKSAQTALEEIGLSQDTLGADLRKPNGLLVGLEDIKKHLDNSGKSAVEQNRAILTIFGGARSATAAQTLIQNIGDLNKQYDKLPGGAANVKKLDEAWKAVEKTPAQQIAEDEQKVNAALTELGQKILPVVLPVVSDLKDDISGAAEAFSHLSTGQQKAIIDFALAGTAIALVSKPIGALVTGVGLIEKGLGTGGAAAAKFAGSFRGSLAETVPVAETAGASAGNAYGTAFAAAAERGVAEVRVASMGAGGSFAPYAIPGVGKSKVPGFGPMEAGMPGLGRQGFTAAEQAAAMDTMVFPAAASGPGFAAILKGLAGNAVKGGVLAGGGVMASQLAGQLVGGRAGSDISSIGSGAAIGAGIGTVIAPGLGTAIGAGLGSVPGIVKALEGASVPERAGKAAGHGLPDYGTDATHRLEQTVKQIRENEHKELSRLQPGAQAVDPGETAAEARAKGMRVINPRNASEQRQAEAIKSQAGLKEGAAIGGQEAAYIKSGAILPQLSSIIDTAKKKMKELGPAAKDGMYSAMVGMVKELESKGRLPQGATKAFIDTMHKQFSTLGTYSKEAAATTVREWELMRTGGAALRSADQFVGHILGAQKQIPLTVKTTSQEAARFFSAAENELLNIVKHSTGDRHRIALQAYNELRSMDSHFYANQRAEAEAQLSSINTTIKTLSHKGSKAFIGEWQSIEGPLKKLWEEGYLTTEKYTVKMNELVEGELSSLGVKPNAIGKKSAKFGAGPGSSNGLVSGLPGGVAEHRADGGYIGHPGERGRDEVPIWVGRGEAVANHDQQPYIETGLAASKALGIQPYGSLHELFANVRTTHYASGGVVAPQVQIPGAVGAMAQGGLNMEARALNRVLNAARPKAAHSASVTAAGGAPTGGGYDPSQTGSFDGIPVARWIIPENVYARAHGWTGPITSGIRLGFDPHAPGGSEHALNIYPGGAEDFGGMVDPAALANRAAFIKATSGYTGKRLLTPIGFRDDGHMSGTGHAAGGFAARPSRAEEGQFSSLADGIWSTLSQIKALPASAHKPRIIVQEHGAAQNDPFTQNRQIHFPWEAVNLAVKGERGSYGNNWARNALVHEMAHTMQTDKVLGNRAEAEGGAVAWSRERTPQVLSGYSNPPLSNYAGYFAAAQRKGMDWINHKQFRARGGFAGGGFVATAYGPPWGGIEGGGTTATGVDLHNAPHRYIVAVDPSVIPLHTKMRIWPNPFGYHGDFEAEDTGGAIKGNRIDFYDWEGRASQNAWGRRNVTVTMGDAAAGSTAGGNYTAEAHSLEGQLEKLKREKINLPTPAAGKAGAGTRAADTAARKRIANQELTIREKLKGLPKAHSGLVLSAGQEAAVGRLTGEAGAAHSLAASFGNQAAGVDDAMSPLIARWEAHPQNLATAVGAENQKERDELIVKNDKAKLKFYAAELKAIKREAANWAKLRDSYRKFARHAHGTAKKQALDKAASYQAKVEQAQKEAKSLGGSIASAEAAITEAEQMLAALPGEAATAQAQALAEGQSNDLSAYQAANAHVDLQERAGDLTPAQAKAAKEANARKALAGGFGALSEEGMLQVKGDLREFSEATQEATSAVEAHTQALKDSAKALTDFLNASNALAQVETGSILKSLADVISGQIAGVGYHGRRLTPGAGTAANY